MEIEDDVNEENDVDDGVHNNQADVLVGEGPIDSQVEGNHDHRVEGQAQYHPVPDNLPFEVHILIYAWLQGYSKSLQLYGKPAIL